MSIKTSIRAGLLATGLGLGLAAGLAPGHAVATPLAGMASAVAAPASTVTQVQYYYVGPPRYRGYYVEGPRYYYGPRYGYYGPRRYYRDRGDGIAAGIAAGAVGALALGALAAGAAQPPEPTYAPMAPPHRQDCARRFRSYDPATGTYVGRDGRRRFCG